MIKSTNKKYSRHSRVHIPADPCVRMRYRGTRTAAAAVLARRIWKTTTKSYATTAVLSCSRKIRYILPGLLRPIVPYTRRPHGYPNTIWRIANAAVLMLYQCTGIPKLYERGL